MLIDVHAHTFPDAIAERALKKLVEKTGHLIEPAGNGTVLGLLDHMRRDRVDYAVVCPVATKPDQFGGILAEALNMREGKRGEDARRHLIPFASVHPSDDARFAHLAEIAKQGVLGVKLHPYYQSFTLDAPEMLDYFRCCRDNGLIVQCHCGFDIGFPFDPICNPARVAHVFRDVPGLKLIAAHLGGWRNWDEGVRELADQPLYLDTAVLTPDFGNEAARRIIREHPAAWTVFGTDWPWLGYTEGLRYIRSIGLSPAHEAAVLGGNAARLLGITAPSPW
jgi:predicted TIM-barrel fold metal-dependent hydrolase